MGFIENILSIVLPAVIAIFCILIIVKMAKTYTGGVKVRKLSFQPKSVGDRLKKYIILAAKTNPNKSKILKMRRTAFNEGGIVG